VFAKYPGHVGPAAPAPPAPAPAPPAPAPAAPAPAPEVVETPTPTATPEPTPTATADATRTPEPRGTEEFVVYTRDDPAASGPPWWPFVVGVVLVAAAGVMAVRRQRLRR
jgi:hypothetical protein